MATENTEITEEKQKLAAEMYTILEKLLKAKKVLMKSVRPEPVEGMAR